MSTGNTLLFAYGTLKKGEPLHHVLREARMLGEREVEGIQLHGTPYDFPAAVRGDGRVRGEVYEVTQEQLTAVDKAEGVPNMFKRERVAGYWVYLWARDEKELI